MLSICSVCVCASVRICYRITTKDNRSANTNIYTKKMPMYQTRAQTQTVLIYVGYYSRGKYRNIYILCCQRLRQFMRRTQAKRTARAKTICAHPCCTAVHTCQWQPVAYIYIYILFTELHYRPLSTRALSWFDTSVWQ